MTRLRLPTTMLFAAGLLFGLSPATYSQVRGKRFQRVQTRSAAQRRGHKVRPKATAKKITRATKLGVISGKASRSQVMALVRNNAVTKSMQVRSNRANGALMLTPRTPYIAGKGQLEFEFGELNMRQAYIKTRDLRIKAVTKVSGMFLIDLHIKVVKGTAYLSLQGAGSPSPKFSLPAGTHHVIFVTPREQTGYYESGTDFNVLFGRGTVQFKSVEITQLTP